MPDEFLKSFSLFCCQEPEPDDEVENDADDRLIFIN